MSVKISIVGKGGTGKTTISALLIDFLIKKNKIPILAVDADPNFNLNELLGLKINTTLSEIRENLLKNEVPDFMSRYDYTEMKLHQILIENKYFDLLTMGYPEKSGCYCPIHHFLSCALEKLINAYEYVVIDNEAGMEHISRLNVLEMDHLIIVSDPTKRGIATAVRIVELIRALNIKAQKIWLIVNQTPKNEEERLNTLIAEMIKNTQIKFIGFLPQDLSLLEYELNHIPVFEWECNLRKISFNIFEKLFNEKIKND